MTNFVALGQNGEHIVPENEVDDHSPHDFCDCHPRLQVFNGRWIWVHQASMENQLFEQADAIRQCVSIDLWREIEGKKLKFHVMPFPHGFQGAVWPQPAAGHARP